MSKAGRRDSGRAFSPDSDTAGAAPGSAGSLIASLRKLRRSGAISQSPGSKETARSECSEGSSSSEIPGAGQFRLTWKDLIENQAHITPEYDPLLEFIFSVIPDGCREVPDFRIPDALQRQWRSPQYRTMRDLLHQWRFEHDEDYRVWAMTKETKANQRKAKLGWIQAGQEASELLKELEQQDTPSEVLLALRGVICLMWDPVAKPGEKHQALNRFAELRAKYDRGEPEDEKAQQLQGLMPSELITIAMSNDGSDPDADPE